VPDDLAVTLDRQGFAPLPVSLAHAEFAARLPLVHRDPRDRLLIAQARLEGLSLVSADPLFGEYGVELVW
jgi:PIN domain nuclease of toxin-antitoxin system